MAACSFGADTLAVYQMGAKEQVPWIVFKDVFKERGYDVLLLQGETRLEKHIEKMGKINRSQAKFLLAIELSYGEEANLLVAMTDQKGAEGAQVGPGSSPPGTSNRFLPIDQLPGKYASQSRRLAEAVAASYNVKVKHLSLFPLVGADMPGIFLRIECKQDKAREMVGLLARSIQNYVRRDVSHERYWQAARQDQGTENNKEFPSIS